MRQKNAFKRGPLVAILAAGGIGCLIGAWHVAMPHGAALSAAQTIALRFPMDWGDAPVVQAAAEEPAATTSAIVGNPRLGLFNPAPMVDQSPPQMTPSQAMDTEPTAAPARVAMADAVPVPKIELPKAVAAIKRAVHVAEAKVSAASGHHHEGRPGFMLDDAQIASIKTRLHLTPDQEEMWPAVEAALRNIAYTRAREARRHNAAAGPTQIAAVDPNSSEVQGLKSAAIPLIMSFNSEQKDEVRNLAHVMGLDQLASQF
jgi:hypothetical protein